MSVSSVPRRALLLDRDGVINHDAGYTHRWDDFVFVDGIFDLARAAHQRGYLLMVVTNQAGIGRGLYTEDDFHALTARMSARFSEEGAPISRVYFDPTHPEHGLGDYRRESFFRKPNPGMLLQAAQDFGLSLADSVLVGDKPGDILADRRAGVGCCLLYRPLRAAAATSGLHDADTRAPDDGSGLHDDAEGGRSSPTAVLARLADAIDWLL